VYKALYCLLLVTQDDSELRGTDQFRRVGQCSLQGIRRWSRWLCHGRDRGGKVRIDTRRYLQRKKDSMCNVNITVIVHITGSGENLNHL